MLMNYHEMTMNEPRDSPARRKQFLLICTVMAVCFGHSVLTSGVINPIHIEQKEFPGGEFIYKYTNRDYASSMGLARSIGSHLQLKEFELDDIIFCNYLDDPNQMGGRQLRFASGLLVRVDNGADDNEKESLLEYKTKLLEKNKKYKKLTKEELENLAAFDLWERLYYHSTTLPKVKAAVLQFPFTNGFVSALTLSHKVIPAMRKYAKEHAKEGTPIVVLTTCSVNQSMCTHYTPLEMSEDFLLGKQDSEEYLKELDPTFIVDKAGLNRAAKKIIPGYKSFVGESDDSDPKKSIDEEKEEEQVKTTEEVKPSTEEVVTTTTTESEDVKTEESTKEEVKNVEEQTEDETTKEEVTTSHVEEENTEEEMNKEEKTEEAVTQEEIKTEEVTQEEIKTEEVTQEEIKTEEVTQEEIILEEVAQEEVATEEVAQEEVKREEVAQEEEVTKEEVTEEESTKEEVNENVNTDENIKEEVNKEESVKDEL